MNRAHSADEAFKAIELCASAFDNVSLDLIYGIPGLTDEKWMQNIEKALSFGIPHISSYALTVEPNTALDRYIDKGLIDELDDEQAQRQYHILREKLETSGFVNYELSNFGKTGFYSRNNSAYWQGAKYLGVGPGAHSFDGNCRTWNVSNNHKYIKALQLGSSFFTKEELTKKDRYNESVMTGLRTIWGVSYAHIEKQFGPLYRQYLEQQAQRYIEEQLLFVDNEYLLASQKGRFFGGWYCC